MTSPIPAIAAGEYTRRRAAAGRKVAQCHLTSAQAQTLVRPWLAIAIRAGADLPEITAVLDDLACAEGVIASPPGSASPAMGSAQLRRAIAADDVCPRARLLPVLRDAAAMAVLKHEQTGAADRADRARGLIALVRHFRAGPITFPTTAITTTAITGAAPGKAAAQ